MIRYDITSACPHCNTEESEVVKVPYSNFTLEMECGSCGKDYAVLCSIEIKSISYKYPGQRGEPDGTK